MSSAIQNPAAEIEAGNPWYVADQASVQLQHPAYLAVVQNRWAIFERAISKWADLSSQRNPVVLDAGCGDGINLRELSRLVERFDRPKILGTDYSRLRIGRAASAPGSRLTQSSLTHLPYQDNTVDILLCNQVLEHISETDVVLRQLYRVLRPGGLLILGVPNEGCLLAQTRNHFLQRSISRRTDHVNFFTASTLRNEIERTGFTVYAIEREGFFWPHLRVHTRMGRSAFGRRVGAILATVLPSQAAGLIGICRK